MTGEEAGILKRAGERAADRVNMEANPHRDRAFAIIIEEFAQAMIEIEVRRAFRTVGINVPPPGPTCPKCGKPNGYASGPCLCGPSS